MASASPSPTPNPDAMKYTLDTTIDGMLNVSSVDEAEGNAFAVAVLSTDGVASLFGTADFVTVTRSPGADWESITAAVRAAAAEHL